MPTVKTYQRQVTTQAAPAVRRSEYRIAQLETPAGPVPKSTAGIEQFGNTAARVGEDLLAAEQKKQDQIRLLDADRQAGDLENSLMYDPKTGALNVKGQAAFGLIDTVGQQWDQAAGKIRQGLSNDRQRLAFDQYNVAKRRSLIDRLNQHIAKETYRVDGEALEGKVENETEAAVADGRPERINQAVHSVAQAYQDYGERYGMAPEQTKAATDKATSRIHVGVIDRMLQDGNDIQAKVYYEHAEPEILGEHRGKIEAALHEGSLRGESQRAADSVVSGSVVGMVEKPTISQRDTFDRPILDNETGEILPPGSDISNRRSYSTTSSMSFEENGKEILIPTVVDGKRLSQQEAIDHYHKTGEHLGKFDNPENADRYATWLHNRQERYAQTGDGAATLQELLGEAARRTEGNPELRDRTEARIRASFAEQQEDERIAREKRHEIIRGKLEEEKARKESEKAKRAQLTDVLVPNLIDQGQPKNVKTFLDTINPQLWSQATQKEREEWERYAKREEKGEKVKTDFGTYYNLLSLSSVPETRDAFAKTNLNDPKFLNRISEPDLKKLAEIQAEIRKGNHQKANQLTEGYRTVNEMVGDSLRSLKLDPNPKQGTDEAKRLGDLRSAVDQDIADFESRSGKKPTKPDIQGFIDQHLIKGTVQTPGWFGTSLFAGTAEKSSIDVPAGQSFSIQFNQIPKADVRKIEDALARAGLPESEATIVNMYLRKIRKQR
jgi:hypothetical protein